MKSLTLLEGFQQKTIALAGMFRNLREGGTEVAIEIIQVRDDSVLTR